MRVWGFLLSLSPCTGFVGVLTIGPRCIYTPIMSSRRRWLHRPALFLAEGMLCGRAVVGRRGRRRPSGSAVLFPPPSRARVEVEKLPKYVCVVPRLPCFGGGRRGVWGSVVLWGWVASRRTPRGASGVILGRSMRLGGGGVVRWRAWSFYRALSSVARRAPRGVVGVLLVSDGLLVVGMGEGAAGH